MHVTPLCHVARRRSCALRVMIVVHLGPHISGHTLIPHVLITRAR